MIRFYLPLFLLLIIPVVVISQNVPIGAWKSHFPYSAAVSVTEAKDRIFCATTEGIFYYDRTDNSLERLNKVNGLSDIGVTRVAYNADADVVVVTYSNANIDLIYDNSILNISDVKRSNILGNKTINNLMFTGTNAYLACGFGVVVLDLVKKEIRETYFIGNQGNGLPVYEITTDGQSFFAATDSGVYQAPAASPFLSDFSTWIKHSQLAQGKFNAIAFFGGKVYANRDLPWDDSLYVFDGNSWNVFNNLVNSPKHAINVFGNRMLVVMDYVVKVYNENAIQIADVFGENPNTNKFRDAIRSTDDIIWIADLERGLLKQSGNDFESIVPNGPLSSSAYSLTAAGEGIYAVPGGRNTALGGIGNKGAVYHFSNNSWYNYKNSLDTITDIIHIAVDPSDNKHIFASSWDRGLVEMKDGEVITVFNNNNSSLSAIGNSTRVPVGGSAFDQNQALWVCQAYVNAPLSVRAPDGTWKNVPLPSTSLGSDHILGPVIVDDFNNKWIVVSKNVGILVYNDNNTPANISDDKYVLLTNSAGDTITGIPKKFANFPSATIYSIAKDLDGEIWIGTDKGVAVFYSPGSALTSTQQAQQIFIQQDGYNQYLLESEAVSAIAVDAGNRKWFGTLGAGVFLMSEDGTKQLLHFTEENSPLPSNEVLSIAINQKSGEIFFGTTKGLVSYRGSATEGGEACNDAKAFPNPVRENYNGIIAISGVINNSNIKITDAAGNLVYETFATGGMATWNGNKFSGERVKTGVYVILSSNEDGTQTCTTKLLVIN